MDLHRVLIINTGPETITTDQEAATIMAAVIEGITRTIENGEWSEIIHLF